MGLKVINLTPDNEPKNLDTNEACPVCGNQYDFVDVIPVGKYDPSMDLRPICTRVSNGDLIEVYHHESLIGGDMFL